jgi:hypothetical protein
VRYLLVFVSFLLHPLHVQMTRALSSDGYFFPDSEDEVEERCSVVDSDNESEHVGSDKTSRGEFMSSHCP